MLGYLSPVRRRFVLVVVTLLALTLVVVVVLVLRSRPAEVTPVAQDRPGPVLLVPGYGGSTTSLDDLAAALRNAGREVFVVRLPDNGTGDLQEQAQVLGDAARAAIRRTGSPSVDVVGYSAGGVVARVWVRDDGGGDLARRVVSLGSPQHGTDVAALATDLASEGCPVACRQLATDSDLLRGMNAGDETPPGPLFVSIWTTDDKTVVPPESATLAGALNVSLQSVCPSAHVSHGRLPSDPTVIAMTLDMLAVQPPVRPGSGVCSVSP